MLRTLVTCLVMLLFTVTTVADAAAQQRRSATRTRTAHAQPVTSGPYCNVASRCAFMVMDARTGTVLESRDIDKRVYPASLTKLMTVYLLLEAIDSGRFGMTDRVTVSDFASSMPALKIGFTPGQSIAIEDLLEAVLVKSANDAAVVIAEALAGSETAFARQMTNKARQLGMHRTTFRNASGLPNEDQVTTARDMATLARSVINDFPRYRRYFGLTQARVNGRIVEGHNHMLKRGEIDGGKTGYINSSGYNLVAWAERDGRMLIGAVFGGRTYATRDAKMLELLRGGSNIANRQALPQQQTASAASSPWRLPLPSVKPGDGIASMIDTAQMNAMTDLANRAEATPAAVTTTAATTTSLPPNVVEVPVHSVSYTSPTFSTSWAVQVGAYRDAGQAQQALDKATREIPSVLGATYPRTIPTNTNVGQLHRAQLVGLDERQAKAVCVVLSRKGMQCLPMPPTG